MIRSALILCTILLLLAACSRNKDDVAGKYTARNGDTEIVLTLDKDGKGVWSTDMDEIRFKWSLRKNDRIWLHTREGGVIQGVIEDGGIRLTLPGVEELVFQRQQQ